MEKLTLGQEIFLKLVGNAARRYNNTGLIETKISKIGKKHFYVEYSNHIKFDIKDLSEVSNYSADYEVYLSKKEFEDETKSKIIYDNIKKYFSGFSVNESLTLEKLIAIEKIINEKL